MAILPVLLQIQVYGHCPALGRGVPCSVEVFCSGSSGQL